MVHSKEWSTSFLEKGRNQAKAPKYRELVVHFKEWTTGFLEKGGNPGKCPEKLESYPSPFNKAFKSQSLVARRVRRSS